SRNPARAHPPGLTLLFKSRNHHSLHAALRSDGQSEPGRGDCAGSGPRLFGAESRLVIAPAITDRVMARKAREGKTAKRNFGLSCSFRLFRFSSGLFQQEAAAVKFKQILQGRFAMKDLKPIRSRQLQAVCFLFAVLLALAPSAFAQTGLGAVTGTVRDSQKSVIRNANVTLTNTSTNITRKSVTNDEGIFVTGSVPLGPYTLVVESSGFKRWEGKLELQVGQHAVIDPVMEAGAMNETVNVTGAAPLLQTESIDVSNAKDYQRIQQLPLNGRNISSLFDLTPGIEGGGSARVNGLKVGSLEITLDGISLVDRFGGGIARVEPGLETVQEFQVEAVGS